MPTCNICGQPLGPPVYRSARPVSVTSLCEVLDGHTEVFHCPTCQHVQTTPLPDLAAYYDKTYQILVSSEEEDQLYAVANGRRIYRTEHQVETLLRLVELPLNARVLDFGCAKAATLKALCAYRSDIQPHVFDVSEMYRRFWNRFVPTENQATYQPKPEWDDFFDAVTSFFALEHVAEPRTVLAQAAALLRPNGVFYGIVPNTFTNIADFVVADHVNHFTAPSLRQLCAAAGLVLEKIEDAAHTGAWVFVARKKNAGEMVDVSDDLAPRAVEISAYWSDFGSRVRAFEQTCHDDAVAIYGAGFYGTFIATQLERPEVVVCFLDQNPHRQKQMLLGKPILPPERVPAELHAMYVGLNPIHARATIQAVPAWSPDRFAFFYP